MQVEAKYPALLFKQQLDAFVQKIFPMLRDNVKKLVIPLLAACIHSRTTGTGRTRRTLSSRDSEPAPGIILQGRSVSNAKLLVSAPLL